MLNFLKKIKKILKNIKKNINKFKNEQQSNGKR